MKMFTDNMTRHVVKNDEKGFMATRLLLRTIPGKAFEMENAQRRVRVNMLSTDRTTWPDPDTDASMQIRRQIVGSSSGAAKKGSSAVQEYRSSERVQQGTKNRVLARQCISYSVNKCV